MLPAIAPQVGDVFPAGGVIAGVALPGTAFPAVPATFRQGMAAALARPLCTAMLILKTLF